MLILTTADPELDIYITKQMALGHIPGLSGVVISNGSVVWQNTYGYSDPENKHPATKDTLFTQASISKTVISFVLMRLFDKGYFGLDDDVSPYVGFRVTNPNAEGIVTFRQLMTHTSSINDQHYGSDAVYSHILVEGDSTYPLGEFLQDYLVPDGRYYSKRGSWHLYKPGKKFDYSNIGASLAAYAAECIASQHSDTDARQTYNDLAKAMFAEEFGLELGTVGYHVADVEEQDVATPSHWTGIKNKNYCLYGYPDYPDGSFRASPSSYAHMFRTFMDGGAWDGKTVLKPDTIKEMKKIQVPGSETEGFPQGLIWYYDNSLDKNVYLLGHNGGDAGVDTDAFFNPDTGIGFVVFTNGDPDSANLYSACLANIEKRLMKSFDSSWPEDDLAVPGVRRKRNSLQKHAVVKKLPCGITSSAPSTSDISV